MKLFVYGAGGQTGGGIVEHLLAAGHEVVAGRRDPDRGEKKPGLSHIAVDSARPQQGLEVLERVDGAFLLSPAGYLDQYGLLAPWVNRAREKGLKKIVLMTAMGVEFAPPEAPFRKLELLLEGSGLDYTILRPNWFMQNFQTYWIGGILKDKTIFFPGGQARASFIDVRDIVASASVCLTSGRFKNRALALTGPAALTHDEVAATLSDVTGIKIKYADISPEEFKKGLLAGGVSPEYADVLVYIAGALRDGHAAAVTESVAEVTGKAPISFQRYAEDNRKAWLPG